MSNGHNFNESKIRRSKDGKFTNKPVAGQPPIDNLQIHNPLSTTSVEGRNTHQSTESAENPHIAKQPTKAERRAEKKRKRADKRSKKIEARRARREERKAARVEKSAQKLKLHNTHQLAAAAIEVEKNPWPSGAIGYSPGRPPYSPYNMEYYGAHEFLYQGGEWKSTGTGKYEAQLQNRYGDTADLALKFDTSDGTWGTYVNGEEYSDDRYRKFNKAQKRVTKIGMLKLVKSQKSHEFYSALYNQSRREAADRRDY